MVLEECVVSSGLAGSVGAWVLVVIMFVVVEFVIQMVRSGHKQNWHPLARG